MESPAASSTRAYDRQDGVPDNAAPSSSTTLWLWLLLLAGCGLRALHWSPGAASDDSRYMNFADLLARGEPLSVADAAAARFYYEGALALTMALFGSTTLVASATGLVSFAVLAYVLFRLTALRKDRNAGLLAVFLLAVLPIDIVLGTYVLPDSMMTIFTIVASIFFLSSLDQPDRRRQVACLFAAGGMLGLAVAVKEYAVCAALAFGVYLLWLRRPVRAIATDCCIIAVGGSLILGLEMLGFYWWTGDALYRFATMGSAWSETGWSNPFSVRKALSYALVSADSLGLFGIHAFIIGGAVLSSLDRRSRKADFPLIFCLVFTLFLSVGSVSLTRYELVPHQPRYFLPVLVMGIAIASVELRRLASLLAPRWPVRAALATVLICISLWATKEYIPPTAATFARTLAAMTDESRSRYVLSQDLVRRQALEVRDALQSFATIDLGELQSAAELTEALAGRGLAVSLEYDSPTIRRLYAAPPELTVPLVAFLELEKDVRVENVRGPSWPPYKRLLGLGEREIDVGRILWPAVRSVDAAAHPASAR